MPRATRSCDHHTYRCYRQGPDGVGGLPPCGPGAHPEASQRLPEGSTGEHPGHPPAVSVPATPPAKGGSRG